MSRKSNDKAIVDLFATLGLTPERVAEALGIGTAQVKARRAFRVELLEGSEAEKYGDVAIQKANGNGTWQNKVAFRTADLPAVIAELQAAQEALTA